MTLRHGTVIEAEAYDKALTQLGLAPVFETITGTPLSDFDVETGDLLPITLVEDTLAEATGEYYLDPPATGSDPRYRIIQLHRTEESDSPNRRTEETP